MKKISLFLLSLICLCVLQACSDDDNEEPIEDLEEKGYFSLLLTERIVQGYAAETGVPYAGVYWNSLDAVDIYLVNQGRVVEEKGHRLHVQADGTLASDTMELSIGAYTISKLVLFDRWGEQAIEYQPTSSNTFVLEEGGFLQKDYKIRNLALSSFSRDSVALAALMKANFGNSPSDWPINLTRAPETWDFAEYSSTYKRVIGLHFNAFQEQDREDDMSVTAGWGSTGLKLKVLPPELQLMDGLQMMDFTGNEIEEIPAAIGSIRSIYAITLNGNKIKQIPAEILGMTRLNYLNLENNPLESLPVVSSASNLLDLVLADCQLTSLGSELANCKSLERLDVRGNRITAIGDLTALAKLQVLDISDNELTTIPAGMLPDKMTGLYASGNQITSVSGSWNGALVVLNLSNNRLQEVPADFFNMPVLQSLSLSDNELQSVPDMSNLLQLFSADFSNNKLISLPESIAACDSLRKLDLTNNASLDWTLPEILADRYCTCVYEIVDFDGNTIIGGTNGLFVNYKGCPLVRNVPAPPQCGSDEGEDGGF